MFSIIVLAIVLIVFVAFPIMNYISKKNNRPTPEQMAAIIERFVDGSGSNMEWDEFTCVPIYYPELDKYRVRCIGLEGSEEGKQELREIAKQLRAIPKSEYDH